MAFKVGDVVVLNSGGPKMTVAAIKEKTDEAVEMVLCIWFDDIHGDFQKVHDCFFNPCCLFPEQKDAAIFASNKAIHEVK